MRVETRAQRVLSPDGRYINYCCVVGDHDSGAAVFVDPAWDAEVLLAAAAGWTPRAILLTHSHRDHVHLAAGLSARLSIPVMMSRPEIEASGFACEGLVAIDRERLWFGGLQVEVLRTPGHTAGSICFRIGDDVFTGDTLFIEGCGLPAAPGGDMDALFESLMKLDREIPDHCRVFPGHRYGDPVGVTMARVRERNIYLHLTRREDFVRFRLRPRQAGPTGFL